MASSAAAPHRRRPSGTAGAGPINAPLVDSPSTDDRKTIQHQLDIQHAVATATARHTTATAVVQVNDTLFNMATALGDYVGVPRDASFNEARPKPGPPKRGETRVLPMPIAAGIRDAAMASIQMEQQTSAITHHSLQQKTLEQCSADIARAAADVTTTAGATAPETGEPAVTPLGSATTTTVSKRAIARKYGIAGSKGPNADLTATTAGLTRKGMDPTNRKIFFGVAWGHGAAVQAPNVTDDPTESPAAKRAKYAEPTVTPLSRHASGSKVHAPGASLLPVIPKISYSTKDAPPAHSIVVHDAARSTIISRQDPLVALSTRPINLDPLLAVAAGGIPSNTGGAAPPTAGAHPQGGSQVNNCLAAAVAVASNIGTGATAAERSVVDQTAAVAAVTAPPRKAGRKRKRADPTIQDDNEANDPFTSKKVSLDARLLQDADTAARVRDLIKKKCTVQMQPEDSTKLFSPLRSVVGVASSASKVAPSYPNLQAAATTTTTPANATSDHDNTEPASLKQLASIMRVELMNWGITRDSDASGVSLEDARHIARSKHTDVPLGEFVNRMHAMVAENVRVDTIYNLGVFDEDIVKELQKADVAGRGGVDETAIDYRFVDLCSKAAARAEAAVKITSDAEAKQAERGAVFAAFKRMEERMERQGRCCFSLREKIPDGTQSRARPKMETISREHFAKYMIKPLPEDVKERGLRLCKSGLDCVSNILPNAHYAKLYTNTVYKGATPAASAEISSGRQPFARRAQTAHLAMSTNCGVTSTHRLFASSGVSRDTESFINVEYLTPEEEARFEQWWSTVGKYASPEQRLRDDPRNGLPQLCYPCYVREISIRHNAYLSQQVPDGQQNTDPVSRDFVPLNRFQVLYGRLGEYAEDVLIKTTTGAGVAGASRLGTGRSLVIGAFPDFHLCNYETLSVESVNKNGTVITRPAIMEVGMDFRLSSAK